MKYTQEGRKYDWQIALGIFALNFLVVQYVIGTDGVLAPALVFALSSAVFSIALAGGFLYFVVPDKEQTKSERKKTETAIQILGVLSLLSAVVAFGGLILAIHTYAFVAYIVSILIVAGFGIWQVDLD
jgi:hypothetical protein